MHEKQPDKAPTTPHLEASDTATSVDAPTLSLLDHLKACNQQATAERAEIIRARVRDLRTMGLATRDTAPTIVHGSALGTRSINARGIKQS